MKNFILLFFLIFSISFVTFAQNTLSGRITNSEGEPMPSATIVITHSIENGVETLLKTQKGTTTDLNGFYILPGIGKGIFLVKAQFIGYEVNSFQVDFNNEKSIEIKKDVILKNSTVDIKEVVVTSQAKGQMAAINQQLSSNTIKNVVSADRIRQNPDANAAESIGRLPGVSVTRSGGEANDVIIRGMPSQYNRVMLNGIELPSNKGEERNANLSGVSQNSLQGIEVFKAITPDMDANTVSGAVNMVMGTAPDGFHGSILAQGGYNNQNSDFGNYKFDLNLSNRFINSKLGIDFSITADRVNRSTQNMGAGYGIETADTTLELQPMYNYGVGLNSVEKINKRTSASLVVDYRFSQKSKIEFSNFYSSSPTEQIVISKAYSLKSQSVGYGINENKGGHNKLYSGALRGEHVIGIINIDYNLAYSTSDKNEEGRGNSVWNPAGFTPGTGTRENMSLPLASIINMANDEDPDKFGMGGPGSNSTDKLKENQYNAALNFEIPFQIGEWFSGNVKFGGMYRYKNRNRDYNSFVYGGPPFHKLISGIQTTPDGIEWKIPWARINDRQEVSAADMVGGSIDNFLDGQFNFGWYPDVDKMNEVFDWWINMTDYYRAQGRDYVSPQQPGWQKIFGQERMMGWLDPRPSVQFDNSIKENYYAGYLMTELNLGKKMAFIPGVRLETVNYKTEAWWVERRLDDALEIPGYPTADTCHNNMILPMIHLKIKPNDWFQIQASYTKTLFRPNYNWIVPYEYLDNALRPYQYEAGVPDLKVEKWNNFDLMFAFYGKKIGLFSINGFYKTVQDKIWRRTWTRISSDDPVPGFRADQEVDVTSYYNNEYKTYVRGFELEWQTNFRYLPKPFSYFTLTANYSYINNEEVYPDSRVSVVQVGVNEKGKPIFQKVRSDSYFTGPMINQPSQLANVSLGFSYRKFDIWTSYQYIGKTTLNRAVQIEFDSFKSAYYRFDVQGKYELPFKKLPGLQVLFNVSNLNNIVEKTYLRGESRPAGLEAYGWTSDLGIRYKF